MHEQSAGYKRNKKKMVGSKIYENDSYLRAVVGNYRESGAMQFKKFEFLFIAGNSWKLCKLGHFQNAPTKKRKAVYSSSLQGLIHISQSYFQAIFYLDLGFFSISYTRTKNVMFRHLLTP